MCSTTPSPDTAISTAFVVRRSRSVMGTAVAKKSWLQKSGIQATAQWMPVWQYHPEDKTSSVWVYASSTSTWPEQKQTWTGVSSLADGRHQLAQQTVSMPCFLCMLPPSCENDWHMTSVLQHNLLQEPAAFIMLSILDNCTTHICNHTMLLNSALSRHITIDWTK